MKPYSFDFECRGLRGTAFLPSPSASHLPTAVFCHGWGGSRKLFRYTEKLLAMLIRNGFAAVTFDFFGCGESCGDMSCMTYGIWADNIGSIVEWTSAQSFANSDKIGIVGFSSGTAAAFRYAVSGGRAAFIVSVAACVTANIGMSECGPYGRGEGVFMGQNVGEDFFKDCIANAPAELLERVACPVLLLQGGKDNVWRVQDSLYAASKLRQGKLKVYENSPHSLSSDSGEAARDTVSWLKDMHII